MIDLSNIFNLYNPQIPTIFDDSLSYLQMVGRLRGGLELVAKQSNENEANLNKKVSYQEMKDTYKLDKNGDFKGSWFGIKSPSYAEPGIADVVEKNRVDILNLKDYLNYMPIDGGSFIDGNGPTNPIIDGGTFDITKLKIIKLVRRG